MEKRKQTITARQIKAARALLDWSQEDLSEACGLSIATVRKLEAGHISPRDKTMTSIVLCLEKEGVEFFDSTGVRVKKENVKVIEGPDCYSQFLDEVYHSMKNSGGELLFFNADNSRLNEVEMMAHLRLRRAGVRKRALMEEGNTRIKFPIIDYRWVPKKYFRYNLIGVYQDKFAVCYYDKTTDKDMDKVYIFQSAPLAEAMRGIFEFMWDNCRIPSLSTEDILE